MEVTEIHGWRTYTLTLCSKKASEPILVGAYGMHVHTKDSPMAVCRGFNFASAPWVVDEPTPHEEWEVPHLECSCGYRGLFTIPPREAGKEFVAHVTALGETWIHDEGFRTAKYTIDFFLKPSFEEIKIFNVAPERIGDASLMLTELANDLGVPIFEESNCEQCSNQRRQPTDQGSVDP